ncbi:MAG TPA: hypothetical protein VE934_12970 [Polaromonas sp.]|uniref:hypothetical protein n=1 Tax=Polaromonas sp. TaxID=1869339 RepID=UPI002D2CFAE9|nr:hypothetical protein [Polaromonas sp.]HYW57869.1 hypothetical protein [Polaromonas sp.]
MKQLSPRCCSIVHPQSVADRYGFDSHRRPSFQGRVLKILETQNDERGKIKSVAQQGRIDFGWCPK